eukprot:jgi/Ulvmu1/1085/UM106_0001.1
MASSGQPLQGAAGGEAGGMPSAAAPSPQPRAWPAAASAASTPVPSQWQGASVPTAARRPPPPPPPAQPLQAAAPPNITVVRTAAELQQASLSGAMDIEIRTHIDMRSLELALNPMIQGAESLTNPRRLALLYASLPLRSIRGNCSDPDPTTQLGLTPDVSSDILPMRPFQCLIMLNQTWLMVNSGEVWIDNVYLKLSRRRVHPEFTFITAGALNGELTWPGVQRSDIYLTRTTFQGEHRGNARGIISDITGCSVYVDECVFTDWAGFHSPFTVKFQSHGNIRNSVFRNMHLEVEIADVSFEGIVRFENVSLANVTLNRGAVVSTTLNDYQQPVGFYLTYYAEDDEDFDVEIQPVPPSERGVFGEEFVIVEQTMSNCLYLLTAVGTVWPGCPQSSLKARNDTIDRGFDSGEDRTSTGVPIETLPPVAGAGAVTPAAAGGWEDYSLSPLPPGEYSYKPGLYDYSFSDVGGAGEPLAYSEDYDEEAIEDYRIMNNPLLRYEVVLIQADDEWLAATRQLSCSESSRRRPRARNGQFGRARAHGGVARTS